MKQTKTLAATLAPQRSAVPVNPHASNFLRARPRPLCAQISAAPLKKLSGSCLVMQIVHFRAHVSAASLKRWRMPTQLEIKSKIPPGCGYKFAAIATRLDSAEMPSGRWIFQRRSFWSTCRTTLASLGGWLMGESTSRKSCPIWTTVIELPLTNSRILTWAEWPP